MDPRCPKQLQELPKSWCPVAVIRLKALRKAGGTLTEEEEAKLPGCPYAIDHQQANFCLFNWLEKYNEPLSYFEIASALNISEDEVKEIEKRAIEKIKDTDTIKELNKLFEGERKVDVKSLETYYD
jgi:hypothetical protein